MELWVWNLEKANCITCEVELSKCWKGSHADLRNSSGFTVYKEKLFHNDDSQLEQVACGGSAASIMGSFHQAR